MNTKIKKLLLAILDIALFNLSLALAFYLSFDGTPNRAEVFAIYYSLMIPLTVIRLGAFFICGLYDWSFYYASLSEALRLFSAVTAGTMGLIAFIFLFYFYQFDNTIGRSVILMEYLLSLFLATAFRFSIRGWIKLKHKFQRDVKGASRHRTLILGAGDLGELVAREMTRQTESPYQLIGFLDNSPQKQGVRIHGVKVLGNFSKLAAMAQKGSIQEVIIAVPKISGEEIKEINRICTESHLILRILPSNPFLFSPQILTSKIRNVDASDLLGREIVQIDVAGIQHCFRGKRILVTGAGGSIGSELVKILLQTGPEELILVDATENNLHEIETSVANHQTTTQLSSYLCDVTHAAEMEEIFERHRPHIIYHAAAHKHVPLVERYFRQGIINNVFGTKVVAGLALEHEAERFILISTDKAIRPRSIMGATKRMAELYIQSLKGGKTHFLAVRFGNVLNSKGSVVPLFRKQLEQGAPVTVTHPEVTRYFMDLSEAVFLILQATFLGTNSEIFVLDMGSPIKIVDLVYALADLMGISIERVNIQYVGLRPGEKLNELIELDSEEALPTKHHKIKIWKPKNVERVSIQTSLEELLDFVTGRAERAQIIQKICEIVPEYQPSPSLQDGLTTATV